MCTVTIIPKGNSDFILTSNRDEAPSRVSLAPEFYSVDNTEVLFPKDELSGGTWIGVSEKKRVICVLNGGFEIHERKTSYRLSRGVVAKQFMVADSIEELVDTYNFEDIEPFTIVIADWNTTLKFYELVWDGIRKYFEELPLEPKMWSSSTLYDKSMRAERQQWFVDYKLEYILKSDTILEFHKTAGASNEDYGVVMDRGFVKTTSITQIEKNEDSVAMYYENIVSNEKSSNIFKTPQVVNE
ncbi:NRDE family protein [Hyunsoonleella ulvae]|uniref:NRDE family protein n=1 Tax=Hyunsoonleella ulvae TaxID=2799948 RepID=UPI0019395C51|nr:NRDE family protein [Hyunsoonleella ulvae]